MSELSRTILAGGRQVVDANRSLAAVRARNKRDKADAFKQVGLAAKGVGDTLKEHGDWKQAKAAETDLRALDDAYGLGWAAGGADQAKVALSATRASTPAGAAHRVALLGKAEAALKAEMGRRLTEAQIAHYGELDEASKADRLKVEERNAFLRSNPQPPDASPAIVQAYAELVGGMWTPATFVRRLEQIRKSEEAEREREFKATEAEKKLATTREIAEMDNATRLERLAVQREVEAGRTTRHQSSLDARKSNADNANAIKVWIAGNRRMIDDNRLRLAARVEERRALEANLDSIEAAVKIDMQTAMSELWASGDDGAKLSAALREKAELIAEIREELAHMDKIQFPNGPPAPALDGAGGQVPSGHPSGASPEDVQELEAAGMTWDEAAGGWVGGR